MVQFGDNSLHYLSQKSSSLQHVWTREEGLSGITQLEVVETPLTAKHTFEYVKMWEHETAIQNAPQRIIQTYVENIQYMIKILLSTKEITTLEALMAAQDYDTDIYGFKKSIIALTKFGNIFSFSSFDGSIMWKSNYFPADEGAPRKILIRKSVDRQSETS